MIERITKNTPAQDRHGHEYRYKLAADRLLEGETVLDAACGVGYGAEILSASGITYHGVDVADCIEADYLELGTFKTSDIEAPAFGPRLFGLESFDVTVSFETIEHLRFPEHFITRVCDWTKRLFIASVPVVPTKEHNPFHLHDFEPDDLPELVPDGWSLLEQIDQPSELSAIYVFERRSR